MTFNRTSPPLFALRKGEVFENLETSAEGLDSKEAEDRRLLYGQNILAEPPSPPTWRKWFKVVAHPMALLLWVAGMISLVLGHFDLGIVVWMVVLVNAGFSFWREYRADRAVNTLKNYLPACARVVRSGLEIKIPAIDIVPGDVLALSEGDNIPADARLVDCYGLRVNTATLTGGSLPAIKTSDPSLREDLTEIERPNLVFAGMSVVSGTGRAVVYRTGMATQFGRIANLTQAAKEEPSLIQTQMAHMIRYLSAAALGIGVIVFFVSRTDMGFTLERSIILAIGIVVAVIPEGLAPTVALTLAIAAQRLAQRGVLVKKLSIVETLGLTSVVCTDKSGTLTQNQMTVRKIWVAGQHISISGVGYEPTGTFSPALDRLDGIHAQAVLEDVNALFTAAMLCNNSHLIEPSPEQPRWTSLGDQTEAALRVLAMKGGLSEESLSSIFPRVHELPFDARRKRMSTVHRDREKLIVYVKGAPREVLQLCSHIQRQGRVVPLDDRVRAEILEANDDFARSALRVLALARCDLTTRPDIYTPEGIEQELTFLGLAAMMDPPRPEVASAVQSFRSAGIRLVMITGDYGLTAESVARRIGMLRTASPRILTGADLDSMSELELQEILECEIIFSRMAPEHKLRLVAAYQSHGDVVAAIGDGVNDTPALRKADIGIAMGVSGSDVTREAADVILVDDNFESIVHAVEEGRAVYDNLRKFISYIFASNIPEILPFILRALFDIPLALTVVQILAIDLGTDLFPALALGIEKPEPDIMQRPPRKHTQPLVDKQLLIRAFVWLGGIEASLAYLGFFTVYSLNGFPLIIQGFSIIPQGIPAPQVHILATTVFHVGVVMAQVGNAFACRTENGHVTHLGWLSNRPLLVGVCVEILMILAIVYNPTMAAIFEHLPVPPLYWAGLILFGPLLYGLERIRRSLARRNVHHRSGKFKEDPYESDHYGMWKAWQADQLFAGRRRPRGDRH